ncbi:MAG: polysaccharide deacetylase family protein, partial [Candidatus Hadarchaeum sp.]
MATIEQFRLDRFITLFFFRPLQRFKPRKKGVQIPILMYHSISNDPEPGVRPYYKLCTSPRRLQEHMAFLKDAGYQVIPLSLAVGLLCAGEHEAQSTEFLEDTKIRDEAYATGYQASDLHSETVLSGSHALPVNGPFVVLTFDDGYRDFYTTAWPILSQFGFTATVFIATAFVGGSFKKRDCL